MLIGIPELIVPDLLYALAKMGHGDEVAVVDRNYPAYGTAGEHATVVDLPDTTVTQVLAAIASLMPADDYADAHVLAMESEPGIVGPATDDVVDALVGTWEKDVKVEGLDRHDFYSRCGNAAVVVRTSETRPYACFIVKKGVV